MVVGQVGAECALWGGGKGAKLAKIQVLMEVVEKNDGTSKHQLFWSNYVVT